MKRWMLLLLAACLLLPALAETPTPTPTPAPICNTMPPVTPTRPPLQMYMTDSERCLEHFLQAWAENDRNAMLELCAPSWKSGVQSPELELFLLIANRVPLAWHVQEGSGEEDDAYHSYHLYVLIAKGGDSEPAWQYFTVFVLPEDGAYYVQPTSLATHTAVEAPDICLTIEPTSTPAPTDEWWISAGSPADWADHNARFADFMSLWAARDVDGVLTLLPPGWQPDSDQPWWTLQQMFYIYVPDSYRIRQVTVAEDGRSVTYSVRIVFTTPVYELQTASSDIVMRWTDGGWYVDPETIPAARALFVTEAGAE